MSNDTQNTPPAAPSTPTTKREGQGEAATPVERIIINVDKTSTADQRKAAEEAGITKELGSFTNISGAAKAVRARLKERFDYRLKGKELADPPPALVNELALAYGKAKVKRDE